MVSAWISMFIPVPASRRRRRRELHDLLQREADSLGPGWQQGQHVRMQEREEKDRRHPNLRVWVSLLNLVSPKRDSIQPYNNRCTPILAREKYNENMEMQMRFL